MPKSITLDKPVNRRRSLPAHRCCGLKRVRLVDRDRGATSRRSAPQRLIGNQIALANCTTDNVASRADRRHAVAVSSRVLATGEAAVKGESVARKRTAAYPREHAVQGAIEYHTIGKASWYGEDFHGGRPPAAKTFNMNAFSAAHPSLPLPCNVRITNLVNQTLGCRARQ